MKKSIFLFSGIALLILQSCSSGNHNTEVKDTVFTKTCYVAVDGKDTARLTLNTFSKGVKGKLLVSYYRKAKNEGDIKGIFKGDTLLVDYGFRVGDQKTWYKNPLAFLNQNGQLIMGIGQMQNTWGRTYFKKGEPIDFKSGRFIFEPVPCP